MRKLIAAMKISVDGKYEGAQGYADWVHGWSDDYGLTPQIDACVLGSRMYDGYEPYWTAISDDPDKPLPQTGAAPTRGELEWADFARSTPHYVVSASKSAAAWSNTRFLRGLDDVAALKSQPGKDIYLMGGATLTGAALDADLVDEIRLIVYPLIAGTGPSLFGDATVRHPLELRKFEQLPDGRLSYVYDIG
ncbi:dihydrofolate reductase family protein [Nocardia kruczakiae]|uniref:dihydrofolate reductase family protein n=1 Tax=Nocardia kruczakiae TaxID=261477 RepID=UPI0007A42330|nr:dihydrofolate reductase family protein [Nocardia kruczakiae]